MVFNIYLTNLGKYNEGELVGKWVSLPTTNGFDKHLEEIGINDEYEEWFITDYETDIEGLEVGEYDNIAAINERLQELESMEEWELEEVAAAMEAFGYEFTEAVDRQQRGYVPFLRPMRKAGQASCAERQLPEISRIHKRKHTSRSADNQRGKPAESL